MKIAEIEKQNYCIEMVWAYYKAKESKFSGSEFMLPKIVSEYLNQQPRSIVVFINDFSLINPVNLFLVLDETLTYRCNIFVASKQRTKIRDEIIRIMTTHPNYKGLFGSVPNYIFNRKTLGKIYFREA